MKFRIFEILNFQEIDYKVLPFKVLPFNLLNFSRFCMALTFKKLLVNRLHVI